MAAITNIRQVINFPGPEWKWRGKRQFHLRHQTASLFTRNRSSGETPTLNSGRTGLRTLCRTTKLEFGVENSSQFRRLSAEFARLVHTAVSGGILPQYIHFRPRGTPPPFPHDTSYHRHGSYHHSGSVVVGRLGGELGAQTIVGSTFWQWTANVISFRFISFRRKKWSWL